MQFVSKFNNWEPFSTLKYKRIAPVLKDLLQRAESRLQKRIVSPDKLMYDYNNSRILDAQTKELFNGKFLISGDKFERVVRVKDGKEVANLVRTKGGQKYYAERKEHGKIFENNFLEEDLNSQVPKLQKADQEAYDKMVDNFEKRT